MTDKNIIHNIRISWWEGTNSETFA